MMLSSFFTIYWHYCYWGGGTARFLFIIFLTYSDLTVSNDMTWMSFEAVKSNFKLQKSHPARYSELESQKYRVTSTHYAK